MKIWEAGASSRAEVGAAAEAVDPTERTREGGREGERCILYVYIYMFMYIYMYMYMFVFLYVYTHHVSKHTYILKHLCRA